MSDDKSKPGAQDRERVDVNKDDQGPGASKKSGVSAETLKAAMKVAGDRANAIEQRLKSSN